MNTIFQFIDIKDQNMKVNLFMITVGDRLFDINVFHRIN